MLAFLFGLVMTATIKSRNKALAQLIQRIIKDAADILGLNITPVTVMFNSLEDSVTQPQPLTNTTMVFFQRLNLGHDLLTQGNILSEIESESILGYIVFLKCRGFVEIEEREKDFYSDDLVISDSSIIENYERSVGEGDETDGHQLNLKRF